MPQVEHHRPVRLSDIIGQEHNKEEEEDTLSCLSSLERFLSSLVDNVLPKSQRSRPTSGIARQQRHQKSRQEGGGRYPGGSKYKEGHLIARPVPNQTAIELQRPMRAHTKPHGPLDVASIQASEIIKPSVNQYKKTEGEVAKRIVEVSQASPHHTSVHLAHTPSNNYREKDRHTTHMTTFSEFIRSPRKLTSAPPPLPRMSSIGKPARMAQSQQKLSSRAPRTVADLVSTNAIPASNHLDLTDGYTEINMEPQECNMCGIPNSPRTRYGKKGLWLCSACRSPASAVELPPRIDSKMDAEPWEQPYSLQVGVDPSRSEDKAETCQFCHTSLPSVGCDGLTYCSWCCRQTKSRSETNIDPTGARLKRTRSQIGIETQNAESGWEDIESQTEGEVFEFHVRDSATESLYYGRRATGNVKPTPPLKDSVYLSKTSFPKVQAFHVPQSAPPSPPLVPPKAKVKNSRPRMSELPDRESFYPDTPTLSPESSRFSIPLIPAISANGRNLSGKTIGARPFSPKLVASAKDFPYPPPPIPDDRVHRPRRSSSVYPDSPAPRIHTPDWQHWNKHRRNTSFYDYWETILG